MSIHMFDVHERTNVMNPDLINDFLQSSPLCKMTERKQNEDIIRKLNKEYEYYHDNNKKSK
jgi:hypothetical protein